MVLTNPPFGVKGASSAPDRDDFTISIDPGSLSDGSNVPQISHPDIEELELPLPPSEEERELVHRVAQAGDLLDKIDGRLQPRNDVSV